VSDRIARLESQLQPDPEHDRLITRINAKLDMLEQTQRSKQMMQLGSNASTHLAASAETRSHNNNNLHSSADGEMNFLQDRIDRLTALRARYAREEKELLG
jgi:hypothetical protein